eukprot:15328209-Ditylum_brightwellii.AAC.1
MGWQPKASLDNLTVSSDQCFQSVVLPLSIVIAILCMAVVSAKIGGRCMGRPPDWDNSDSPDGPRVLVAKKYS